MASAQSHTATATTTSYADYWDASVANTIPYLEWEIKVSVDTDVRISRGASTIVVQYLAGETAPIANPGRDITKIEAKGTSTSGTITLRPSIL